ncbi:MAG: DUF924 domain-containing protein [Betaproteobacteria bacterium]|nr:MAG: DUF924 domain-containing protein [Betaproteobacteria bacterium]
MHRCKDPRAGEVLTFWFRGAEARKEWFQKDPAFDAEIRTRFLPLYEEAASGALAHWQERAPDCLALIVLLDQFPRNLFRTPGPEAARAFATDALALAAARRAIDAGYDRELPEVARTFFYLPFEHSENFADQERSLQLFAGRPNEIWAVRHWEVVKRFGRFPHRNAALGRESTPDEIAFLQQPGSGF